LARDVRGPAILDSQRVTLSMRGLLDEVLLMDRFPSPCRATRWKRQSESVSYYKHKDVIPLHHGCVEGYLADSTGALAVGTDGPLLATAPSCLPADVVLVNGALRLQCLLAVPTSSVALDLLLGG